MKLLSIIFCSHRRKVEDPYSTINNGSGSETQVVVGCGKCYRISFARMILLTSVADPHWFQCGFGSSILGQFGSGSKVLKITNREKKIYSCKKKFCKKYIFFLPNCNLVYLSLGL
jgi:hypothetical protein